MSRKNASCNNCNTTKSFYWHRKDDIILCTDCNSKRRFVGLPPKPVNNDANIIILDTNTTDGNNIGIHNDSSEAVNKVISSDKTSDKGRDNLALVKGSLNVDNGETIEATAKEGCRSNDYISTEVRGVEENKEEESNDSNTNEQIVATRSTRSFGSIFFESEEGNATVTTQESATPKEAVTIIASSVKKKTKPTFKKPAPKAPDGKNRNDKAFKNVIEKDPGLVELEGIIMSKSGVMLSRSVAYKGQLFTVGDIVAVRDRENNKYYGQLRGFMSDQYCDKTALITWLLPTNKSPPPDKYFDPATYVMGLDDDTPRKMECFEFIMHAPPEFKIKENRFPPSHKPGDFRNLYAQKFLTHAE